MSAATHLTDLDSLTGTGIRPDASSFQTWRGLIRSRADTSFTFNSSIFKPFKIEPPYCGPLSLGRETLGF